MPADRVALALQIEADRMENLTLDPADWNVERKAVLHEWDEDHDNSFLSLFFDVNAAVYPHSPLGKPALGERTDITRATVGDLRSYYRRWYAPNNATIVVTGDVVPSDVFAQAASAFARVAARPVPPSPVTPAVPAYGATVNEVSTFPIEVDDVAYALPDNAGASRDDVELASIFSLAINNARSSVHRALVESGLTLGYIAVPAFARHASVEHVLLVVTPGRTGEQCRSAFLRAMAQTVDDGLSQEQFEASRLHLASDFAFGKDSLAAYARGVGGAYVYEGDGTLTDAENAIARATAAAVDDAGKRYFMKPNAIGILSSHGRDLSKFKPPTQLSGTISDSFSDRIPGGKVVEPRAIRESLQKPLAFTNAIHPTSFTLPNGVRVVLQVNHANPTTYVYGKMARSPAFQAVGKDGIADLLDATLPYGSAKYTFDAQREVADTLGAILSFGSTFSAHGYARDLGKILDVIADDLREPALPSDRFALLRTQFASTSKAIDVLATIRAAREFDRALYPAGDPILRKATAMSLTSVSEDDLRAYAATYLRPDLLTIVIVGDIDEAGARSAVTDAFGSWSATGPQPDAALPAIPPAKARRELVHSVGLDLSVSLGQVAPAVSDADFPAFNLMNSILGNGSFDSRLVEELREKRGLVYGISSKLVTSRNRSTMKIEFTTSPADEAEALAGIRGEMLRLQRTPVSAQELARGKIKLVSSRLLAEASSDGIAAAIMGVVDDGVELHYFDTLSATYAGITAEDVRRVANKWLSPKQLVEVLIGP